jgi:nitrite reductase (NADH) small subunit
MSDQAAAQRIRVGVLEDFAEGDRVFVTVGGRQVAVFLVDGTFVAYQNTCAHQGGPVCEGRYFPRLTATVDGEGRVLKERYDRSTPHLVCPWHGWEYNLRTGEFAGNPAISLIAYQVEIEGKDVYVVGG